MTREHKNRLIATIVYRCCYLTLMAFAVCTSIYMLVLMNFWPEVYKKIFHMTPTSLFYFSYLSTYFAFVLGILFLADSCIEISSGRRFAIKIAFKIKYYATLGLALTFIVANTALYPPFSGSWFEYVNNNAPIYVAQMEIFRFWAPLLFIVDFFVFDERGKINLFDPFVAQFVPAIYILYVFLRSPVAGLTKDAIKYPYYFLNPTTELSGMGGPGLGRVGLVILSVMLIALLNVVVGIIFWFIERQILRHRERKKGIIPIYKAFKVIGIKSSAIIYSLIALVTFTTLFTIAVLLDLLFNEVFWISCVMSASTLLPLLYLAFEFETKFAPFLRFRKIKGRPLTGKIEFIAQSYMSALYREIFVSFHKNNVFTIAPCQNPLPFFQAGQYKPGDKLDLYFPEIGGNPIAIIKDKETNNY